MWPVRESCSVHRLPLLETPRLRLRGWRDDDVEAWIGMNADERVREFFPDVASREESLNAAQRLRSAFERDGYGWWVLERKERPGFAGVIALQPIPFEAHFTPAHEIGWRLPVEAWGHGYASEGAAAAMRFAFEQLHLGEVVAITASINRRSRAVMERLEMTHDPRDDFDHPRLEFGHRLQRHVLYRAKRPPSWHSEPVSSEHERRTATPGRSDPAP